MFVAMRAGTRTSPGLCACRQRKPRIIALRQRRSGGRSGVKVTLASFGYLPAWRRGELSTLAETIAGATTIPTKARAISRSCIWSFSLRAVCPVGHPPLNSIIALNASCLNPTNTESNKKWVGYSISTNVVGGNSEHLRNLSRQLNAANCARALYQGLPSGSRTPLRRFNPGF